MSQPNEMTPGEVLAGLQEFVPYVQKHSAARKGYVVGMRRKNKRDEIDEVQTYLCAASVRTAVADLIAERDGYKSGWWDVVDMLGGKKLADISNAQYHASVLVPKIRELIARNAELEADNKALREDAERWRLARILITPGVIDIEESERANEGDLLTEQEAAQSDATIDRIRKAIASDAARAEGCGNG